MAEPLCRKSPNVRVSNGGGFVGPCITRAHLAQVFERGRLVPRNVSCRPLLPVDHHTEAPHAGPASVMDPLPYACCSIHLLHLVTVLACTKS